jgi:regulator of replication initiation timing
VIGADIQIRELNAKVKNLERSLNEVVKEFEAERNRLLSQGAREAEELRIENGGLKKLLKSKEKEYKKMRVRRARGWVVML